MLTKEQSHIVDTVVEGCNKVIAVNSIAGSGKTATAEAVIKTFNPRHGFYTAFNRAVVEEAQRRFGNYINAKTLHALAYSYVRPRKVEEFTYSSIKEKVPYFIKSGVITHLDEFFRSKYIDIDEYLDTTRCTEEVKDLVKKYADKMLNKEIPPSFSFLLKCLHLMLYYKEIDINYDLFVFDEVQDVIPVTLEIFNLINADVKIVFGDKFQNIYSFMDTVNAFEELQDVYELKLTKSFRCCPNIAEQVEKYGKKYLENDFIYTGNNNLSKRDRTIVYLSRYNATLINRIHYCITNNISFRTSKPLNTIFELPIALLNANAGKPVYSNKYKYLEHEYYNYLDQTYYKRFFDYIINVVDDNNINYMIEIIRNMYSKGINIFELFSKAKELVDYDSNVTLSTIHTFKGLEADKVILEDDINNTINNIIYNNNINTNNISEHRKILTKDVKEILNLYYVALSRARYEIENVRYI